MSKLECEQHYSGESPFKPLFSVRVDVATIANRLRLPYWVELEPGMGEMHSFGTAQK